MDRIIFLDTYYPQVFKNETKFFGTADYYSEAFKSYGWEAIDVIANDPKKTRGEIFQEIEAFNPTVIYFQDLSWMRPDEILYFKNKGVKIVGQISSPWQGDDIIRQYEILFTSFPHYIKRFRDLNVRAEFLQIGFGGQRVIDAATGGKKTERDIDIGFVGGLGGGRTTGHWDRATKLFCDVAEMYPNQFKWWGYATDETLKQHPTLAQTYQGEAWGLDMYRIYSRCNIVLNRHGEVSGPYSNNMRMFEATGMGALMMTEESHNINQYFTPALQCSTYRDSTHLSEKIDYYLKNPKVLAQVAKAGQEHTMALHVYDRILMKVHRVLKGIE